MKHSGNHLQLLFNVVSSTLLLEQIFVPPNFTDWTNEKKPYSVTEVFIMNQLPLWLYISDLAVWEIPLAVCLEWYENTDITVATVSKEPIVLSVAQHHYVSKKKKKLLMYLSVSLTFRYRASFGGKIQPKNGCKLILQHWNIGEGWQSVCSTSILG